MDSMPNTLGGRGEFAKTVVATAQVIVLVLDTEGRILRFNPFMEKLSGYKLEEVQGKDWFASFLPESEQTRIRGVFTKALDDTRVVGNINLIVTKDGGERQIQWFDSPLADASGKLAGLLAIGHDVTEQLQAENELRDSEERLKILFEYAPYGYYLCDLKGTFLDGNRAAEQIVGYRRQELIGKSFVKLGILSKGQLP
jgi:PAS domain S-box-containing protein